jgi:hypothetical protein
MQGLNVLTPQTLHDVVQKVVVLDEFSFIEMASETKQKGGGRVTGGSLNLGEFVTRVNWYVTILGSYDVVIDMDWLETHEAILNCKMKRLSLVVDEGQRRVIVGWNQGVSCGSSLPYSYGRVCTRGKTLCDPRAQHEGSRRGSRTPSGGEGVCRCFSRGVAWDAAGEGTGVYHRPETGNRTDSKNALSDVDPGAARAENATEGVVGPGTDTS